MTSKNLSKTTSYNILLLGKGYIGKWLGFRLSGIPKFNIFHVSREDLDYHDMISLKKYLLINKIDYVINCSGFTGRPNVDEAETKKEECWSLNVVIPVVITELLQDLEIKYVHISSGCIYSGYEKAYTEEDEPNFGLLAYSSYYSKSKHAFEMSVKDKDIKILRIRMPVCYDLTNPRNYLKKIMDYPNLVDYRNSKTLIPELCLFVQALLINDEISWEGCDIYNVVNPDPLSTKEVVEHLNQMNENYWKVLNPNWVNIEDLDIVAPRSNCILNNSKADKIFKLSPERIMMNMVCNYNNGVSGI